METFSSSERGRLQGAVSNHRFKMLIHLFKMSSSNFAVSREMSDFFYLG